MAEISSIPSSGELPVGQISSREMPPTGALPAMLRTAVDLPPTGALPAMLRTAVDRTKDKERFEHMLKGWINKFSLSLVQSDTKNHIQQLVIEPFLEYILQRSFPYMLIAICVFSGILILVILIFVILLMDYNKSVICPFCDKTFR